MGPAYRYGGVPRVPSAVFVSRMNRCTDEPMSLWLMYRWPVGELSAVVLWDSHWNTVGEMAWSAYMVVGEKCASDLTSVTKNTSAWSPGTQRTPEPNVPLRFSSPKEASASLRLYRAWTCSGR